MNDDQFSKKGQETLNQKDSWTKAILVKELGPEFYTRSDSEIIQEAKNRGFKLVDVKEGLSSTRIDLIDKDNQVAGSFTMSYTMESKRRNLMLISG
ncbi:hypothetical protein ACFVRR_10190 [Gottfriedia sp. NPDC057948]|uniref:hypothetical protein n=1 Tax=Gottfriedia sp. NPDC057948 TaxID=3346287 RepID=UPI0036DE5359